MAPRCQTSPRATNGFNPLKFVEVSQQEAEITRITLTVCFWNRGEREEQGEAVEEAGSVKAAAGVRTFQRRAIVR